MKPDTENRMKTIAAILAVSAVMFPAAAGAESVSALVAGGNKAYADGDYDGAMASYERASLDRPGSPHIFFNKGAALYKKGDHEKAAEMYREAARLSKTAELSAAAKFNLGNCAFKEAGRQVDADLQKALSSCETSVRLYHEALAIRPGYKDAAENIEVVRLTMKSILDEIKKRAEEAAKEQKEQNAVAEKLKELIERQDKAIERNRARPADAATPEARAEAREMTAEQQKLKEETSELADKLRGMGAGVTATNKLQAQQSEAIERGAGHLDNAAGRQQAAAGKLGNDKADEALPDQEEASKELKAALDALAGKDGQQGGEGRPDQQPQKPPEQEPGKEQTQPQQVSQLDDEAKDLIDEEKDNRERRNVDIQGGYAPVDRNW